MLPIHMGTMGGQKLTRSRIVDQHTDVRHHPQGGQVDLLRIIGR